MSAALSPRLRDLVELPRVGGDRERDRIVRRRAASAATGGAGLEPADQDGEVARRLAPPRTRTACAVARPGAAGSDRRRPLRRAAGDDVEFARHRDRQLRRGVVGHRRLRIPVAAVAVGELRLQRNQDRRRPDAILLDGDRFAIDALRRQPPAVGDRRARCRCCATTVAGNPTSTLFWPTTRRCSRRPNCGDVTLRTTSGSASRSVTSRSTRLRVRSVSLAVPSTQQPIRGERRLDVVARHVVLDALVFAEEAAARGELGVRRSRPRCCGGAGDRRTRCPRARSWRARRSARRTGSVTISATKSLADGTSDQRDGAQIVRDRSGSSSAR